VATFLPGGADAVGVVRAMQAQGLTATALSPCYIGAERSSGLLLGFGGTDEHGLAKATRMLGEVLRTGGAEAVPDGPTLDE
ncbi:MAG TPA: hypothetical protein VGB53_09680, partial [Rubricoccaceae bacterium]